MKPDCLLAGPDLARSQRFDRVIGSMPPGSHIVYKLAVHIVDQRLEVRFLFRRQIACRIARILQFTGVDRNVLELGPAQQFAVVGPLHDHADRPYDGRRIGIDLVAATGNVICAGSPDGLY